MTKDQVRQIILDIGIIPVVRANSAELAMQAARAVADGGIPVAEMTMTVPGAVEAIAKLKAAIGDRVLIGAGTVLDSETAARCIEAGAEFIVSPGFDRDTVEFVKDKGVLMMAGALTPTEVITAWKAGSDFVKIFPCGSVGGASHIKALKAALPQIPMVPTGGCNTSTAAQFLAAGASALGIGGELVSATAMAAGDWATITASARELVDVVKAARATRAASR
jgi:2-dehydro-3-deoxyphosphogluconate aldolase/(4S)-4-hydroxy-2-oxoglutarate aldolase